MSQTVIENLRFADTQWILAFNEFVVEILGYPDLLIPNGNGTFMTLFADLLILRSADLLIPNGNRTFMTLFVHTLKFSIKLNDGSIVKHLNCRRFICATGLRSIITEMIEAHETEFVEML